MRGDVDFGPYIWEPDKAELEDIPMLEDQFVAAVTLSNMLV